MSQYVRLFTPSDYSPPQGGMHAAIVLAAVAVVALIVGIVCICMSGVSAGTVFIGLALFLLVVGGFVYSGSMRDAAQYKGTRQGNVTEDNIALVKRSYGISDMRAEQKSGKSVEELLKTENDPGDVQYLKIVAQSDGGGSIRRLTMQIDRSNHLRVYEGTGDAQHLVAPVQSSKEKTEP